MTPKRRVTGPASLLILVFLLCLVFPVPLMARSHPPRKETSADMRSLNSIFVGWVNLNPDEWVLYTHDTSGLLGLGGSATSWSKAVWIDAINSLNSLFQQRCQSQYLSGRKIAAAKSNGDENASGNDLYIKFSDVRIDYDNYQLILSIHFIDPKTNAEIAMIPARPYYGNASGITEVLNAALDEVGKRVQVEVADEPRGKKQ
jgi:hypothetical protein